MKMKNKIAISVIPILIIAIILMNIMFGLFFQKFVKKSEKDKISSSEASVSTYINERINKYAGGVNDWGHWDDTYDYIAGGNKSYVDSNLTESTYNYLDLSFLILLSKDDAVIYQQFYNPAEKAFSEFPVDFLEDMKHVIGFSQIAKDMSGIIKIGESFYFMASSAITDSLMAEDANGIIIFGRQIDSTTIEEMERITGCTISSIHVLDNIDRQTRSDAPFILDDTYSKDSSFINFELAIPNVYDLQTSISISMVMPRDMYISGMKEVRNFSVFNTSSSIVISTVIFLLLGSYITKPFEPLIRDVKSIEIDKTVSGRIWDGGTNEFSFLRKSINILLSKIETSQKELIESEEKLKATLVSVGDGVISVDTDSKVQFLNPVAQKLTGWKLEEAMNIPVETVFHIINEYTREPVRSPVGEVFETEEIVELKNHTLLIAKDGTEVPIEDTAAPIKDSNGVIIGCVLVFRDFSERKEKQRRIEYLSFHDQLTGLYNRRYFEEEIKRIDVKRNLPLSFVYADVNGLKIINDAFGHEQGDQLIQRVAETLIMECRSDDIIARIGGDEFVILLPQASTASVEKLVNRIAARISQIRIMDLPVSISLGWETKVSLDHSASAALKNAENFMYQKKILSNTSKRNGVIKSILNTLLIKSPREETHSIRVSRICELIGKAYRLNTDDLKVLSAAGELHDIGKIAIDETILNKLGSLTSSEWAQIKCHPEIGYRLLGATAEFNNIAECVLAHHERWDGKGYPKGLRGADINWNARVIAVADAFDAMTCERLNRKGLSQEEAVEELKKNAGKQFDPDIVKVFIEKVLGPNLRYNVCEDCAEAFLKAE